MSRRRVFQSKIIANAKALRGGGCYFALSLQLMGLDLKTGSGN